MKFQQKYNPEPKRCIKRRKYIKYTAQLYLDHISNLRMCIVQHGLLEIAAKSPENPPSLKRKNTYMGELVSL